MRRFAPFALVASSILLACGAPEPAPEPARPPNILLVTVDTLRADHLSAYGYPRETSPVLDQLAAEGRRFDQPSVQWPKTGPSFASIFTATYPKDNGIVRKIGIPLPCRFRMLAEELRSQGYQTHAVVANGALGREFFFDQGFDTYLETWKVPHPDGGDPNRAEIVTRAGLEIADGLDPDRPWFLWVHYLDPHWPYTPPPPFSDRFQDDEHFDPSVVIEVDPKSPKRQMGAIGYQQVDAGRTELAYYVARYDAEIAYTDQEIGRLLAGLEELGLRDRLLTVFTADHGESLGDHHYFFDHGRFPFQTCLRVPFIVHYPGVVAPGVDPEPVALIDLTPTLLDVAGRELVDGAFMQGRSIMDRLAAPARPGGPGIEGPPPVVHAEAGYAGGNRWQKVVRDRRFKLVFAQELPEQRWIGGPGVRFTLFDLASDPGETVNVAEEHPEEVERLKRALWEWEQAPAFDPLVDEPDPAVCGDEPRATDAKTEELLQTLGYIDG